MNDVKPGTNTTEFYQTAVVNVIAALVALLAAYGLIANTDAELWVQLGKALVALAMPAVMAYTTTRYASGRVTLKTAALLQSIPETEQEVAVEVELDHA